MTGAGALLLGKSCRYINHHAGGGSLRLPQQKRIIHTDLFRSVQPHLSRVPCAVSPSVMMTNSPANRCGSCCGGGLQSWGLHSETGWLWFGRLRSTSLPDRRAGCAFLADPHSAMSCTTEPVEGSGQAGREAMKLMGTQ